MIRKSRTNQEKSKEQHCEAGDLMITNLMAKMMIMIVMVVTDHPPIVDTEGCSVTQESVPLHLPQADAPSLLPALHRLTGYGHDWAGTSRLRFIAHHVS